MGLFWNKSTKIRELQEEMTLVKTKLASLETNIMSLRGFINARIGGGKNKKKPKLYEGDEDDVEDDDDDFESKVAKLPLEARQFIQGLPEMERQRLLSGDL